MSGHEDEIIRHLMDLKESVGGLNAKWESTHAYTESVSRKTDRIGADLETHKEDIQAHGKAAANASMSAWASGIAVAIAVSSAVREWLKR